MFKSLKGLPSLEFVSSPFYHVVSNEKLNLTEYWKSEVIAKQSLPFELPRPQWGGMSRWVCTLSLGEVGIKTYLMLVWPSWHLQWDSRVPTCCSAD